MSYEPKTEPVWQDPEVRQRAYDKLWAVWVWLPREHEADEFAPTLHTKDWYVVGVYGSEAKARRAVERRKR